MTGVRTVALGGGHGLAASLGALRRVTGELTAIVTVADDGGSSGRLRSDYGVLPPGDLRMALAALCGDDEWGTTWSKVVQHRFGHPAGDPGPAGAAEGSAAAEGGLAGHAVGNLLIVALWDLLGDTVAGLDWVGRLLGTGGRVLPMAAVPLDIVAEVVGVDAARPDEVTTVRGQAQCATTPGQVQAITLLPSDPPAVPEAVQAVLEADWVVLGPGSWFTSVLPHLLVPELAHALHVTTARRLVVLNLVPQPGETEGFSPHKHLEVLAAHAPTLTVDVVLADTKAAGAGNLADLEMAASMLGARLIMADVAAADGTARHDPERLAGAYARIFQDWSQRDGSKRDRSQRDPQGVIGGTGSPPHAGTPRGVIGGTGSPPYAGGPRGVIGGTGSPPYAGGPRGVIGGTGSPPHAGGHRGAEPPGEIRSDAAWR